MIVSALPSTVEVRTMSVEDLATRVMDLVEAGENIQGEAAMDVNRFLSEAALRFARAIKLQHEVA